MAIKKPIVVGVSPINGDIFAGEVLKDGQTWSSKKYEVTTQAIAAVVEHVVFHGGAVNLNDSSGKPICRIVVEEVV